MSCSGTATSDMNEWISNTCGSTCKTDTLQCKTDTSSKHITFIVEQVPGMHPVHVSGILNLPENLLPLSIQNENVAS